MMIWDTDPRANLWSGWRDAHCLQLKMFEDIGEWDEEDINLKKQQIRRKISDAFDFARAAPFGRQHIAVKRLR